MRAAQKTVRQSVSLPADMAEQVRSIAKDRKLSTNRILLKLIEEGLESEKRKEQELHTLTERLRNEQDPEAIKSLGDQLGRMVFGG